MIGQTALLSEVNHKINPMSRLLRYAWIYMWICFQCCHRFDCLNGLFGQSQVYCCLMNKKWHIFAEAEGDRDREMCLFLFGLFSVPQESRTGQESLSKCQRGFQSIRLPVCLSFCLLLSFFDKQSSGYLLMYGFEVLSVHMKTCMHTLIRGMRASRLLILSIISMLNEQLCCCD